MSLIAGMHSQNEMHKSEIFYSHRDIIQGSSVGYQDLGIFLWEILFSKILLNNNQRLTPKTRYHTLHIGPGGRLNKKDRLTGYGDSHVKDKTSYRPSYL